MFTTNYKYKIKYKYIKIYKLEIESKHWFESTKKWFES